MEHTPGPWISEPSMSSSRFCRDIQQAGGFVVLAQVGPDSENQAEAIANARLIAAAPELLRACELTCMTCFRKKPENCKECAVQAALAKATETP